MTIQEALLPPYKNHVVGAVKHSTYKMQLLNSQSTLKPENSIIYYAFKTQPTVCMYVCMGVARILERGVRTSRDKVDVM